MLVNLIIIVIIGLGIKSVYEACKEGFALSAHPSGINLCYGLLIRFAPHRWIH